jgi:HEAT repeat protein
MVSGALARAGRAAHASQADALDTALIAHYRRAQTVEEASALLAALGNSIGASVLPVIDGALRDLREPIRIAAAQALRLAEGKEIDSLLEAAITNDQAPSVRGAAIFAASFRRPIGPAICDALMRAAKSDPAEFVRARAIGLLRQNVSATPQIGDTLAWIADHDSDPGVRRLARQALMPDR